MAYYSKVKIMCEDKIFNELKEIFMDESYHIRPDNVRLVIDFSPDYEGYNFAFTRIGEEVGDTETIETTRDFYFDIIIDIRNPFNTEPIPLSKLEITKKL